MDSLGLFAAFTSILLALITLLASYDRLAIPGPHTSIPLLQQACIPFLTAAVSAPVGVDEVFSIIELKVQRYELHQLAIVREQRLKQLENEIEQIGKESAQLYELNSQIDTLLFNSRANSTSTRQYIRQFQGLIALIKSTS